MLARLAHQVRTAPLEPSSAVSLVYLAKSLTKQRRRARNVTRERTWLLLALQPVLTVLLGNTPQGEDTPHVPDVPVVDTR